LKINMPLPINSANDLTTFRVLSDGTELSGEFTIQSLAVVKNINKIPTAEILLQDGEISTEDFPLSNKDELLPGKEIEIKMGYRGDDETVFKGIIIKQGIKSRNRGSSILYVEAKDTSVKMTVGRKNKYFTELSDSDIIEEIIGGYGLQSDVESMNVIHKEMVQFNATDWDFMVSRAEANGKLVFIDDGKVTIQTPTIGPAENSYIYGQGMIEFETEMDARDQFAGVITKSWDYTRQEIIDSEGNPPGLNEQGNVTSSDLADVIGLEKLPLQHSGAIDDQELQAWSDAKLLRSRLSKIKGRIRVLGNSSLKPGQVIDLAGLGDRFNGSAYVTGVGHTFGSDTAWYTDLYIGFDQKWIIEKYDDIIDKPAAGLLPSIQGLHIGVVTAIHDDPDGEDRIKVKLPIVDAESEGIWARVTSLDAGESRGFFCRPEIDDEVIVGFLNDDPRDPIVLGSLYSSAKPAPEVAAEENEIKAWVTKSEIKLLINDGEKSVSIETPNGNKLLISDDEGGIILSDENSNKITMNADGITIESGKDLILKAQGDINLEGTNIESKAQASFKAEGQAGLEVSSSAVTTVKGSLVQIN
jgi:Rhs element Vgr protein